MPPTIFIRATELSDVEALQRLSTGPKAVWGTLQMPFTSIEFYRKRTTERPDNVHSLVAVVESDVVGNLGLNVSTALRRRHCGAIGMIVRDDWHGRGVGSALLREALSLADNWLNLKRVELDVYVDNSAAIALYTKFGFEQEGVLRAFAFRDGAYVDVLAMARVR